MGHITLNTVVNELGFRLLRTTLSSPANTLLSPASIFAALAVIGSATRGLTQLEIAQALGLHPDEFASAAIALCSINTPDPRQQAHTMQGNDPKLCPTVQQAVALWVRQGLSIDPTFETSMETAFQAHLAQADFADSALPGIVNGWISQRTQGRIDHLVDSFDPYGVLCILTTMYVQGPWASPFETRSTQEDLFHLQSGQTIRLPMMRQTGKFAYHESDGIQILRLPLAGNMIDLCIVLPHESVSVSQILDRLSSTVWNQWIARQVIRQGTLILPRFRASYRATPDLVPSLQNLGIQRSFDWQEADFTGLCPVHAPTTEPIYLSRFIHQTQLEVDEAGLLAAAATLADLQETGRSFARQYQPFTMIVNRPFLCAVSHVTSGVLLFLGNIVDPR